MSLAPDESNAPSHQQLSSVPDRFAPTVAVYNRDTSTVRGRGADPPPLPSSTLQFQHPRRGQSHSRSPDTSTTRPATHDVVLERRPSNSYGHHRQTSIVHGIQHSRNPSFAASSTTSTPLSPELIASVGRAASFESDTVVGVGRLGLSDGHQNYHQNPATAGTVHAMHGTLRTIEDQDVDKAPTGVSTNPLHRRINSSGKLRREHSHSRSHSKHHHADTKSVGEYALHHLFNAVRTLVTSLLFS